MTGGMMNGGAKGRGWMGERSWMWTPAVLALGLAFGWVIYKKRGCPAVQQIQLNQLTNHF
jgi:hypothetical protein